MKALITAGGRATRLRPITWTINKHLIPLGNKPMIVFALEKLAEVGVTDIGINVMEGDKDMERALGDGSKFGVKITYIEQTGGPLGLGHILKCAEKFLNNEPFIFYLGDNIILGSLERFVKKFEAEKLDGLLALSKVKDPNRFGVPVIENGRIIKVIEKPENPPTDFAVTGIYVYSPKVWGAVHAIKPSPRGELEISDVHSEFINQGGNIGFEEITGWWKDTGKPEDLLEGNALILNEMRAEDMKDESTSGEGVSLQGKVSIGKGTKLGPRVLIRGPVVIGENCELENCYIGPYTSIGSNVKIKGAEVEHSIVFDGASIQAQRRVVDSLLGRNAKISKVEDSLPMGHRLIVGDNGIVEL